MINFCVAMISNCRMPALLQMSVSAWLNAGVKVAVITNNRGIEALKAVGDNSLLYISSGKVDKESHGSDFARVLEEAGKIKPWVLRQDDDCLPLAPRGMREWLADFPYFREAVTGIRVVDPVGERWSKVALYSPSIEA